MFGKLILGLIPRFIFLDLLASFQMSLIFKEQLEKLQSASAASNLASTNSFELLIDENEQYDFRATASSPTNAAPAPQQRPLRASQLEVYKSPKESVYPPPPKPISSSQDVPKIPREDYPGNWTSQIPGYQLPLDENLGKEYTNPDQKEMHRLVDPTQILHSTSHYAFSGIPKNKPAEALRAIQRLSDQMSLPITRDQISASFQEAIFELDTCDSGIIFVKLDSPLLVQLSGEPGRGSQKYIVPQFSQISWVYKGLARSIYAQAVQIPAEVLRQAPFVGVIRNLPNDLGGCRWSISYFTRWLQNTSGVDLFSILIPYRPERLSNETSNKPMQDKKPYEEPMLLVFAPVLPNPSLTDLWLGKIRKAVFGAESFLPKVVWADVYPIQALCSLQELSRTALLLLPETLLAHRVRTGIYTLPSVISFQDLVTVVANKFPGGRLSGAIHLPHSNGSGGADVWILFHPSELNPVIHLGQYLRLQELRGRGPDKAFIEIISRDISGQMSIREHLRTNPHSQFNLPELTWKTGRKEPNCLELYRNSPPPDISLMTHMTDGDLSFLKPSRAPRASSVPRAQPGPPRVPSPSMGPAILPRKAFQAAPAHGPLGPSLAEGPLGLSPLPGADQTDPSALAVIQIQLTELSRDNSQLRTALEMERTCRETLARRVLALENAPSVPAPITAETIAQVPFVKQLSASVDQLRSSLASAQELLNPASATSIHARVVVLDKALRSDLAIQGAAAQATFDQLATSIESLRRECAMPSVEVIASLPVFQALQQRLEALHDSVDRVSKGPSAELRDNAVLRSRVEQIDSETSRSREIFAAEINRLHQAIEALRPGTDTTPGSSSGTATEISTLLRRMDSIDDLLDSVRSANGAYVELQARVQRTEDLCKSIAESGPRQALLESEVLRLGKLLEGSVDSLTPFRTPGDSSIAGRPPAEDQQEHLLLVSQKTPWSQMSLPCSPDALGMSATLEPSDPIPQPAFTEMHSEPSLGPLTSGTNPPGAAMPGTQSSPSMEDPGDASPPAFSGEQSAPSVIVPLTLQPSVEISAPQAEPSASLDGPQAFLNQYLGPPHWVTAVSDSFFRSNGTSAADVSDLEAHFCEILSHYAQLDPVTTSHWGPPKVSESLPMDLLSQSLRDLLCPYFLPSHILDGFVAGAPSVDLRASLVSRSALDACILSWADAAQVTFTMKELIYGISLALKVLEPEPIASLGIFANVFVKEYPAIRTSGLAYARTAREIYSSLEAATLSRLWRLAKERHLPPAQL